MVICVGHPMGLDAAAGFALFGWCAETFILRAAWHLSPLLILFSEGTSFLSKAGASLFCFVPFVSSENQKGQPLPRQRVSRGNAYLGSALRSGVGFGSGVRVCLKKQHLYVERSEASPLT